MSHRITPRPRRRSTGGAPYDARLDSAAVTSSQSAVTQPHNLLERSRHKGPLFCLNDPPGQQNSTLTINAVLTNMIAVSTSTPLSKAEPLPDRGEHRFARNYLHAREICQDAEAQLLRGRTRRKAKQERYAPNCSAKKTLCCNWHLGKQPKTRPTNRPHYGICRRWKYSSLLANSLLTGKITGNSIEFANPIPILNASTRANSEACSKIPCATEQGIFLEEQGISWADTVNFTLRNSEIVPHRARRRGVDRDRTDVRKPALDLSRHCPQKRFRSVCEHF